MLFTNSVAFATASSCAICSWICSLTEAAEGGAAGVVEAELPNKAMIKEISEYDREVFAKSAGMRTIRLNLFESPFGKLTRTQ